MITIEFLDEVENVYDISVEDNHNFFANGILVHNCVETALRPYQFCNLTEVNVSDIESQEDLNERVRAAAFIGTLQASYTDFHYLRPIWQRNTEKDALVGVGLTGIGSNVYKGYDFKEASRVVVDENARVAKIIGINPAARATVIKPSGTASIILGTSSGIHAWHNEYYLRRIRVGKNEEIYQYLLEAHPELIEDEIFRPHDTAVISIPQKAPEGSLYRHESPFDLLERVKWFKENWIDGGHNNGINTHNISATISVKSDQWEDVGEWMWENQNSFNGLSVLPFDGGTYQQAPFEDITKEEYERLESQIHSIDLTKIIEEEDNTALNQELACGPDGCDVY